MTSSEIFLDLLYFDLESSLPKTFRGYRYFLLVKDDSIALMFLKPLRSKRKAFGELLELKTYHELQSGKHQRFSRSDWGRDFNSTKSIQWFKDNGVALKPSAPYTLQQNGKDERSMYPIMSAVCSIISQKYLLKSLQDEIGATVVYVQNRCLSMEGKTLFEKCNNQLPDVSNLKVFDCQVWVLILDTTSRTTMDLHAWQRFMVGYEAANQWRVYNSTTKKVYISQDVRFDEGYVYNSQLNEYNKKVGEFWSPEDDGQLTSQEKKLEKVITRWIDIVDSTTTENNVREYERLDVDNNDKSILSPLEEDDPLILSEPKSPPMTESFPHEDNLDHHSTPRPQTQKCKKKAPVSLLSDRETRSMTSSSKPRFWYINGTLFSHHYIHQVLNTLQSGDYLGLCKAQELQTYEALLVSLESVNQIKAIQSKYDSLIENKT